MKHPTVVLGLATALALAGCATKGKQASPTDRAAARPPSAVEVSSMRERAIDLLLEASTSPDPQARANAVEGLSLATGRLRTVLPAALADGNVGVRSVAAMAVGNLQLAGFEGRLRELERDPSPFVRSSAIFALARLGEPVDRTPLAGLLLNDPSPRVRAQAAYILGELGERSALPLLREADRAMLLRASPAEVRVMRLQFAEAMVKLGETGPIEAIRAALYPSRPEELESAALAVQIIGEVGDKASIDQLVVLSAYREGDRKLPAEVRLAIASSLAKLGLEGGSFIADEYVASPTPTLRAQAAHVYGLTGGAGNLRVLGGLMDDPEPRVRVSAAAGVIRAAERWGMARGGTD